MRARLPKGVGGGPGNMNNMIKQAQKMQDNIAELQAELDLREYTSEAGGGMVTATVTGKHRVINLKINPDAIDPEDSEMLEDMIMVAVNTAMEKADTTAETEMEKVTGGMNIPGL